MSIDANKYPALAKMADVQGESQIIGSFLEWLQDQGMTICGGSGSHAMRYMPITDNTEALLARYLGVDLVAAERERCAILADFDVRESERTFA